MWAAVIGSLFSGIGGLELGLEACGLSPVVWQCDSDPCARIVLERHWPGVQRYTDVREVTESAQRPDIICGGFPCQDISNAGKRAGIHGARSGLWVEFARVIGELRPPQVFIENVAALVNRGLPDVLRSLAALGYDAEWDVFSACEVGAPHARERLFLLAYSNCDREPVGSVDVETPRVQDATEIVWNRRTPPTGTLGMADGIAGTMDRLRLLGNAVVPQQAALAYRTLAARIG